MIDWWHLGRKSMEQVRKNFGRAVWEDPNSRSGRNAGVLTPASLPRREPTPPRAVGPSADAASGWTSPEEFLCAESVGLRQQGGCPANHRRPAAGRSEAVSCSVGTRGDSLAPEPFTGGEQHRLSLEARVVSPSPPFFPLQR